MDRSSLIAFLTVASAADAAVPAMAPLRMQVRTGESVPSGMFMVSSGYGLLVWEFAASAAGAATMEANEGSQYVRFNHGVALNAALNAFGTISGTTIRRLNFHGTYRVPQSDGSSFNPPRYRSIFGGRIAPPSGEEGLEKIEEIRTGSFSAGTNEAAVRVQLDTLIGWMEGGFDDATVATLDPTQQT